LRLIDLCTTLGVRVIKRERERRCRTASSTRRVLTTPSCKYEICVFRVLRGTHDLQVRYPCLIDSGLVGSTDFHSSHPQGHAPEHHAFSGRGTTRAEDAQGTPTQSHISPSILVNED